MMVASTGWRVASFPASESRSLQGDLRSGKRCGAEPADGHHEMRFWETYKAFSGKVRMVTIDLGPCMSRFNTWLFVQGLETLALRAERHVYSTLMLERWLEKHPYVNYVNCLD